MARKPKGYWTKQRVVEAAQQCATKREFYQQHQSAYSIAKTNGWLDEVTAHLEGKTRWNRQKVEAIAKKCASKKEFQKASRGAYNYARQQPWYEDVCSHMQRPPNSNRVPDEDVIAAGTPFTSRAEWETKDRNGYFLAARRGLLDAACSHMENNGYELTFWTDEALIEAAKPYSNRTEFRNANSAAYSTLKTRPHIQKIALAHMEYLNDPNKWTYETCRDEALKHQTRVSLEDASPAAIAKIRANGWDELLDHMISGREAIGQNTYTFDDCTEIALQYDNRSDFIYRDKAAYDKASREGWLDTICAHMDYRGGGIKMSEPAIAYYLRICDDEQGTLYKIGITNHEEVCHGGVGRYRLRSDMDKMTVLKTWEFATGRAANDFEEQILQNFQGDKYEGPPVISRGNTELFIRDVLGLDTETN